LNGIRGTWKKPSRSRSRSLPLLLLDGQAQKFLKGVVTDEQAGDEAAGKASEDVLEDA
jgi:hypothetical protein